VLNFSIFADKEAPQMKWFLALGIVLWLPSLADATCYGWTETTVFCNDLESGCSDQVTVTRCVASAGQYHCLRDSGSGLCCNAVIYYSDSAYGTCREDGDNPRGPKPPQGRNAAPPFLEDEIHAVRVYVPGCGDNYMIIEFDGRGLPVAGNGSMDESVFGSLAYAHEEARVHGN
jgi:hypothetical protein